MAPSVLAYWDIRGLAQPIRLLLEYTETNYEEKLYSCGPAPDFDKTCWTDVKFKLGLDFPNLPYYLDGDVKITQSNAILRYIARKNDLIGKNPTECYKTDLIAEQSMDFRNGFVRLCYNPCFDKLKGEYIETTLPLKLKEFSDFLGSNPWFSGDNITFVDFVMYELLDQHKDLAPEAISRHSNIKEFMERFEKLPKIEAYMKSDRFIKSPLNNKMASFGNK